jgi:very-short-patch-repair endonuclease/transposase
MKRLDIDAANLGSRYSSGESISDIANSFGVSMNVIERRLKELGIKHRTDSESRRLRWGTPTVDPAMLASEYLRGESEKAIAVKYGIARGTIRTMLVARGVTIRNQSVANACRMAKLTPEQRLALAKNAHAAVRGIPQSEEYRRKIAKAREVNGTKPSAGEALLLKLLKARGLNPIVEKAIGRYNVDFALAKSAVAVEVFGGHWHAIGDHARKYRERMDYILNEGWLPIIVWHNALYPINERGVDYIVSVHESRCWRKTRRSKEHVIWGNGHGGPVRED